MCPEPSLLHPPNLTLSSYVPPFFYSLLFNVTFWVFSSVPPSSSLSLSLIMSNLLLNPPKFGFCIFHL